MHTHKGRFEKQLTEAFDRGLARWTKQDAELHSFCTDHENRTKEGESFFKLNSDSIATIREDLAADYQAIAVRHSKEVVRILEEYAAADLEIARQVQQYEADKQATGR